MSDSSAAAGRLFVALWPGAATRAALAALATAHLRGRGRRVPAQNLHLTLAFLGEVDAATRARLEAALARVRAEAFTLVLERLGHFRRARVAWSAPAAAPRALFHLAGAVSGAIRAAGPVPEDRPLSPHVTLARKVSRAPPAAAHPPIAWAVDDFALVCSQTLPGGARYRVLRRWPLDAADRPPADRPGL